MDCERLGRLGRAFIRMVENNTTKFDKTTVTDLDSIYNPNSGIGCSNVIANGQVSLHSYDLNVADSSYSSQILGYSLDPASGDQPGAFHLRSIEQLDKSLHIAYPGGADWAVISISARGSSTSRTPTPRTPVREWPRLQCKTLFRLLGRATM